MFIVECSLICSVGLTASSACAAMRAGLAGHSDLPYLTNENEPIVGSVVPGLDLSLPRDQRLTRLLGRALSGLHLSAQDSEALPLLVALAETARPGATGARGHRIVADAQSESGLSFHRHLSRIVSRGHASVFAAFAMIREIFERHAEVPACVVAAADSSVNAATLQWLDRAGRLKKAGNSNGVVPGEAAGALLVRRRPAGGNGAQVVGLGFATESAPVFSDEPFLGKGLANAARAALLNAGISLNQVDFRLSDVTGESYGFKEQALTLSRVLRDGPSELPLWHCADAVGDVGAAAGICQAARVLEAFDRGYAPGPQAIGFTSSVNGERAVAIFRRLASKPSPEDAIR